MSAERPDLELILRREPAVLSEALASRAALRVFLSGQDGAALPLEFGEKILLAKFRAGIIVRAVLRWPGAFQNDGPLQDAYAVLAPLMNAVDDSSRGSSTPRSRIRAGLVATHGSLHTIWIAAHLPKKYAEMPRSGNAKHRMNGNVPPHSSVNTILGTSLSAYPNLKESLENALFDDLDLWQSSRSIETLLAQPLWTHGIPGEMAAAWDSFKNGPVQSGHLGVLIKWYEARLRGDVSEWGSVKTNDLVITNILTGLDDNDWVDLDRIRQIIESDPPEPSEHVRAVDFFISYSASDLAMAREVVEVLEGAGFTTFVQFKDMPTGSNFPIEIDNGLSVAKGFIALFSKAYFDSPHCRAEFAFAYNNDPDGKKRFVRSLYLQTCELPPLARQVIYQNLIGLDVQSRKTKILEIARYSGNRTLLDSLEYLRTIVSPKSQITANDKIGMAPNSIYDNPSNRQDFIDPVYQLKRLLRALLPSLGGNVPEIIKTNLVVYEEELTAHDVHVSWGLQERLIRNAETAFREADATEFDRGVVAQFEDILRLHAECAMMLPRADERFTWLADLRVDEEAFGKKISEPTDAIKEAADTLREQGLTEESFDRGVNQIVRMGNDQTYPTAPRALPIFDPTDENALNEIPVAIISARKSWVVGALSITKDILSVLSSAVTLASNPAVQRAIALFTEALGKLARMLLP